MGSEMDSFAFEVEKDGNNNCLMLVKNPLNPNEYEKFYPEEVSAIILKDLIDKMNNITRNTPIGNVAIAVPIHFSSNQRRITLRVCQLAGLNNVTFINEPSASLLEYKRYIESTSKQTIDYGEIALVIDFGGGTLDICSVKLMILMDMKKI